MEDSNNDTSMNDEVDKMKGGTNATMAQDTENVAKHLREHIEYPATRDQLVAACNELQDFSPKDKKWFADNLPEGTYQSAEEVMTALGMKEEDM